MSIKKRTIGFKSIIFSKSFLSVLLLGLLTLVGFASCGKDEKKEVKAEVVANENFIPATDLSKEPQKAKDRKDTFIATIKAPGGIFLPGFNSNGWDGNVQSPIFGSLVKQGADGLPGPQLAEKWEISKDNLTYTFHINPKAKFSDGTDVTTDDVAFGLTLIHDPTYAGWSDWSLLSIKGGKEYRDGKADTISGIKIIDEKTIEIQTEKVNSQNIFALGGQIISKAYYGKDYKKGHLDYLKELYGKPFGTGPYIFVKYNPKEDVIYKANPYWINGKPPVENLVYKILQGGTSFELFQKGEIDYSTVKPVDLEKAKALGYGNISFNQVNNFRFIYFNNAKPTLKDVEVRKALYYGINREAVVKATSDGLGRVAHVYTSPVQFSYTEDGVTKYDFNPEKAKDLLEKAGWKVGTDGIREKNGVKLILNYLTSGNDDALITIVQDNLKQIGIKFNPEVLDFNALVGKLDKGDYDLAIVETDVLSDPNSSVVDLDSAYPRSTTKYNNPKADKLIRAGVATTNIEERKAIYKELYKELSENPPFLLLSYRKSIVISSGRIENLNINSYEGLSGALESIKIKQ